MITLDQVDLPNKREFRGKDFPVAFRLGGNTQNVGQTLKFLEEKSEEGFFKNLLQKHGVIVIRNPSKTDPETLSKYLTAIGKNSGDEIFVQNGSTAKRTEVTNVLSTANEGPSDRLIYQHNEFSRFTKYPSKLFFVCEAYNAKGGETPVVHGGEFFDEIYRIAPDFLKELSRKGLYMEQIWPLKSDNDTNWSNQFCFGRYIDANNNDFEYQKAEAIKLAKKTASPHCEFTADHDLLIRQYTEPIRMYKAGDGEEFPCFFNSIATFFADVKYKIGGYSKTKSICYNDGSKIPEKYLDLVLEKSINMAYKHQWEKGDIVIVDNYMVSHGRCPWEGERKVLVSMWDTINKPDYLPWVSQ